MTVRAGSQAFALVTNADKAKGDVGWQIIEGTGIVTLDAVRGASVQFSALAPGVAVIQAYDTADMLGRHDTTEITVRGKKRRLIRVVDHWFALEFAEMVPDHGVPTSRLAVSMAVGTAGVHRMYINPLAPGFAEAEEAKAPETLPMFITLQIAMSYARFVRFEIGAADFDPEEVDIPDLMVEIQASAAEIVAQVMEGKGKE